MAINCNTEKVFLKNHFSITKSRKDDPGDLPIESLLAFAAISTDCEMHP